jgi:hypothetical protein
MRSGKLKNKATIYIPSTAPCEWGEVEQCYTELGTYHCSALTKPRREYAEADSVVSKTEYDLRFRYYPELASLPRNAYIVVKGITLQINAIANIMLKDREIQMICEERS